MGEIDQKTVKQVMALRKKGTGWPEILKQLKQERSFIGKVRPLMKKLDPASVLALGPGSPNYGKGKGRTTTPKAKSAKKATAKRARSGKVKTTTILEKVWNLDTPEAELVSLLDGRQIDVKRDHSRPVTFTVKKFSKVAPTKAGGKAISFTDQDQKNRVVNLRDIAAVR